MMPPPRHRCDRGWIAAAAVTLLIASPLLLLMATIGKGGLADLPVEADPAVAELSAWHAAEGTLLLGAFSRYGLHHPGPLPSYVLAPLYVALGRTHPALCLAAVVVNTAWLALTCAVLFRRWGPAGLARASLAVACLVTWAGPLAHWSVWNPDLGLLPLAATVVAAAAALPDRPLFLPAAIVAASFAAQCHVLYVVPAALVFVLAAAASLRSGAGATTRVAVGCVALLAMLWSPVLVEELSSRPGNFSALLSQADAPAAGQIALGDAAAAVATWFPAALGAVAGRGAGDQPAGWSATLAAVVTVGLLVVGAWRLTRRPTSGTDWAGATVWVTTVGCLASVLLTRGESELYLFRWVAAVGAGAIAVTLASSRWHGAGRAAACACLLGASLVVWVGLRHAHQAPTLSDYVATRWSPPETRALVAATLTETAALGASNLRLSGERNADWGRVAAVVLAGTKAGLQVTVSGPSAWIIGPHHRATGREEVAAYVSSQGTRWALDRVRVVEEPGSTVSLIRLPEVWRVGTLELGSPEAAAVLLAGWGPGEGREERFRWVGEGPASLVVPTSSSTQELSLELTSVAAGDRTQVITIRVDDTPQGQVRLSGSSWQTVTVRLPPATTDTATAVLELIPAFALRPSEQGTSNDHRLLSFRARRAWLSGGR